LVVSELPKEFSLESALRWGTLPYIVESKSEDDRTRYLRAYVETYLTEEIVEEQIIRNLPPFSRFLTVAAQSTANIINYSLIARDIASDPSNVRNYFSILEETLLGFFLEPYHRSIRKRQRSSPKFYFLDTGIVRTLSKLIDVPLRQESKEYGIYFENFVITQIKAYLEYLGKQFQLSYFRSADNAEIDLIIERANMDTLLIEIKSASYCDSSTLHILRSINREIIKSRTICLYNGDIPLLIDGVEVLPWRTIFEIL
jgi:predicted AAA+ superfamily ATPase